MSSHACGARQTLETWRVKGSTPLARPPSADGWSEQPPHLLERGTYEVGKALFPHFPVILQMFNVFHSWRQNLGDKIDYKQKDNEDIGDLVSQLDRRMAGWSL